MAATYDEILALNPVAYWTGNDSSSPLTDETGNARPLNITGGTFGQAGATTALGDSVLFDGTDDYGAVDSADVDAFKTASYSLLFWFYRTSDSGQYERFFSMGSSFTAGNGYNSIIHAGSDEDYHRIEQGGQNIAPNGAKTRLTVDTWFMVVGTYDSASGDMSYYLDGTFLASITQNAVTYTNVTVLEVGRRTDATRWLNGRLQHIAIFDFALTSTNVSDIWAGRNTAPTSGIEQAITPATETDSGIAIAGTSKSKLITVTNETATAITLLASKAKLLSPVTETDSAEVLGSTASTSINPAVETNSSVILGKAKSKLLTPATETDQSILIAGQGKEKDITPAMETDNTVVLASSKVKSITFASETDQSILMNPGMINQGITPATETDSSILLPAADKSKLITHAAETDQSILIPTETLISQEILPAIETDNSIVLGRAKVKVITSAVETDNSIVLGALVDKNVAISPAVETDSSIILGKEKSLSVTPAVETNSSITLLKHKSLPITFAFETDIAVRNVDAGDILEGFDYYPMIGSVGLWILANSDLDYPMIGSNLYELL